ncbi:MAG TPA: DUF305 domain-containing protein [Candidatus Limnocylindrales bacterium]
MTTPEPRRFTLFSTTGLSITMVLGLVLGLVLTLVVGLSSGILGLRGSTPGDTSAEAGFARDMSLHHAQAVAMGMIAYDRGTTVTVRTIGGDIAVTQQGQIGIMSQWLRDWGLNINSSAQPMAWMPDGQGALEDGLMPGMATPDEMAALENARGPEVDRLFIKMMIKHHLGGIHMVDGVLKQSGDEDVLWLANSMKAGQQKEIRDLQAAEKSIP